MSVDVFVLAAPDRDVAHERLRATLHASDVGERYTWCEQPADITRLAHWSATFLRMAESASEYVILLEDDALVNRHLLHNVETWRWPQHEQFGAGWLYSPGGYRAGHDTWYSHKCDMWCGSVGALYRRADVRAIHDAAYGWMSRRPQDETPAIDLAASAAVIGMGRRIRQHGPPIVEHQFTVPSSVGHDHENAGDGGWLWRSTRGKFDGEWRREDGSHEHVSRIRR